MSPSRVKILLSKRAHDRKSSPARPSNAHNAQGKSDKDFSLEYYYEKIFKNSVKLK
jgi:hypothetical protein